MDPRLVTSQSMPTAKPPGSAEADRVAASASRSIQHGGLATPHHRPVRSW
jgi:hypothetical protein